MLGGIGFTWEHDAHLYYRRAMTCGRCCPRSAPPAARRAAVTWKERVGGARDRRLHRGRSGWSCPAAATDLRADIRAELAEITPLAGAERNAALAAGGWVMPHLPKPWGRAAGALEQLVIDEELRAASIHVPGLAIGAWVAPGPDPVRHAGTAAAVPAGHAPAGLPVVSALQRAGRRVGPGRADHAGGARGRRLEDHRPEDLDVTGQARGVGHLHRPHRSGAARHDGISYFLVDMHSPGIDVRPLREITGDSIFNQVFLDDVFVPDECVVGEINKGWRIARTTLANERVSLAGSWAAGTGTAELLQVARAADGLAARARRRRSSARARRSTCWPCAPR